MGPDQLDFGLDNIFGHLVSSIFLYILRWFIHKEVASYPVALQYLGWCCQCWLQLALAEWFISLFIRQS